MGIFYWNLEVEFQVQAAFDPSAGHGDGTDFNVVAVEDVSRADVGFNLIESARYFHVDQEEVCVVNAINVAKCCVGCGLWSSGGSGNW